MGNDPPGQFTRALHPRVGRHGDPPANVIPVGRSVIVPANGSLPNIVLSPRAFFRIRRVLERERFDVLHLHEPMTPAICVAVLALARTPIVATHHASGDLGWMRLGMTAWGFLMDRVDQRIAVSERARASAERGSAATGRSSRTASSSPTQADPGHREHTVVFAGRHEPRKGLHVLLRAWPEIHRRTGAQARRRGRRPARGPTPPLAGRRARRGDRGPSASSRRTSSPTSSARRRRSSRRRSAVRASAWC